MNLPSFDTLEVLSEFKPNSQTNISPNSSEFIQDEDQTRDKNNEGQRVAQPPDKDISVDDIEKSRVSNPSKRLHSLTNAKNWVQENGIDSGVNCGKKAPTFRDRISEYGANLKRFLGFVGPGYLIAVGYLDPGNWATDLSGGAKFGYSLLFIILCSNFMAMLLQGLAIKLGVVSNMDLAQACRHVCPRWANIVLYVFCEIAIIMCDLAEVIGSAIALKLLFNIPLPWGVAMTGLDIMILLLLYRDNSLKSARILESLVMFLVVSVGLCFMLELVYSKPDSASVLKGYLPSSGIFTNGGQLYIAIGIIGATVMPHNLYLHSHLVKVRKQRDEISLEAETNNMLETGNSNHSPKQLFENLIRRTIKLSTWDSTIALTFALFVNSAILIVSAANFFYNSQVDPDKVGLFDAYELLSHYLGSLAGFLFALALLIAGQSSTLTATMAGQVVMEGFLGLKLRPWLRRLITRSLAIIPALVIAIVKGSDGLDGMLIASQVVLSLQLPFAVVPLVYLTSSKKIMRINSRDFQRRQHDGNIHAEGEKDQLPSEPESSEPQPHYIDFSNPKWLIIISSVVSFIIIGLDLFLVVATIKDAINGEL
ncbi:hypothetical protein G9A89_009515 [Geosiphon pyriformis]|nr:hypothetical protein G9A89_009515 [Geosiphon pyriformis]